jgi:hypothetical protein
MQTAITQYVWSHCYIDKLTIRLNKRTKGVEEPPMTVELLLVLLLQAENDLHRARSLGYFACVGNDDVGGIPKE